MWFDEAIMQDIVDILPVWVGLLFLGLSYLGSVYVLAPATIVGYLWGPRKQTGTWLVVMAGTYATFVALKPLIDAPRPEAGAPFSREMLPAALHPLYDHGVDFDTGGFPSGHAIAATVFASLAVTDLERGTRRQRLVGAAVFVTFVCFARVALGTHFPIDVIGGVLIGLAWFGAVTFIRREMANPILPLAGLALVPLALGLPFHTLEILAIAGAVIGAVLVDRIQVRERVPAAPLPELQ